MQCACLPAAPWPRCCLAATTALTLIEVLPMPISDHVCRIVREAGASAWSLYWDGAFRDRYASPRRARADALALCSTIRPEQVEVCVEDASGRRISDERLRHEPER